VLEGMYTAAAGMAAQQQRLDAVASDLANVNTTGYKKLRVAFRDLVYTPTGPGAQPGVQEGAGSAATLVGRGHNQGAMQRTERPLDVAIAGPGFLRVRNAQGQQVLTRDGALQIDNQNRLTTQSGHQTGVTVPAGTSPEQVEIGADGSVSVGGQARGRLDLVAVNAPGGLLAQGDNTFATTAQSGAPAAAGAATRVEQGALEASNVDIADSFTEMIESQRAYELGSRAIKMQDELLAIANGVKR
jgi:flagellar basal-body rod protein FlgG